LGIADLIVALGTGFLTSPSTLQAFVFDPPNELMSVPPLVLIPTGLDPDFPRAAIDPATRHIPEEA
jgi:hypothetical protein